MRRILAVAGLALGAVVVALVGAAGAAPAGVPGAAGYGLAPAVPPSGAGDLPLASIGRLAAGAGFSGQGLAMAIAVSLAESSGDPDATDFDSNGTVDRGLWQINSVHTQYSPPCDYDPACSASAAYAISDGGQDWQPWVTYQRGEEIPFLPAALAWVTGPGQPGLSAPSREETR